VCDVIRYPGRKQGHEPIDAVLAELDVLDCHGYRRVTFADDNFAASRGRATELLDALRVWNARQGADRMRFITRVPVGAARNDELLEMCAAAGSRTSSSAPTRLTRRAPRDARASEPAWQSRAAGPALPRARYHRHRMPWSTNIVPAQMTRTQLLASLRWLCNKLYAPRHSASTSSASSTC
jgi:hypothetical protein